MLDPTIPCTCYPDEDGYIVDDPTCKYHVLPPRLAKNLLALEKAVEDHVIALAKLNDVLDSMSPEQRSERAEEILNHLYE